MIHSALRVCRAIALLLMAVISISPELANAERDPLASVVDMPAPQFKSVPPTLFMDQQHQNITAIVNEARLFGVPLVVRAISVPSPLDLLTANSVINGASPTSQQLVQRMAEEWLVKESVETSPGAEDGILLMVIVPQDDHSRSLAAFATGPNALPRNGLTQSNIDHVLNEIIYPFFQSNSIGPGIHTGIAFLSYDNLFAVPARLELNHQQKALHSVTNIALAGGTMLSALGLGTLILWIHRREQGAVDTGTLVSPFAAGALARGRVDSVITTGALLHLVRTGALRPHTGETGDLILHIDQAVPETDPFASRLLQRLTEESGNTDKIQGASIRRIQDITMPVRKWLRDDLVRQGFFRRDAMVETMWVVLGSAGVFVMALFTLLPSIRALSRLGIASIAIAMIAIVLALIWAARRSWTTRAGEEALAAWERDHIGSADMAIVDSIVQQDAMLETSGGPTTTSSNRLARELRGLGAG